jgi:hypothetical protein
MPEQDRVLPTPTDWGITGSQSAILPSLYRAGSGKKWASALIASYAVEGWGICRQRGL